jgi:hypothetical protein
MMLDYFNRALASPAFHVPFVNRHTLSKNVEQAMAMMVETRSRQEIDTAIVNAMAYCLRAIAELSAEKCIVQGCENHRGEGPFVGDLCSPCHSFITRGEPQGRVWANALNKIIQLARELKRD